MNVANAINNLLLAVWPSDTAGGAVFFFFPGSPLVVLRPSNTNNDELKALAPAKRHSLVMAITICAIALVAVVGIAVTSRIKLCCSVVIYLG